MAIKANENIRHNGKLYKPGDIIEKLKEHEEKRLIKLGVAFSIFSTTESQRDERAKDVVQQLEKFTANDLKELAKKAKLEFPGNISKANLIELIIEEEKHKEVLKFAEKSDN